MSTYLKTLKIEFKKFRSQGIFLITLGMTAALLLFLLYEGRNGINSHRIIYTNMFVPYFEVESEICMLCSIFLPVMASIIASKLIDEESKHNTWAMLSVSNQSLDKLFDVKFLITYLLIEISTLTLFISGTLQLYWLSHLSIPFIKLTLGFLALSMVNFISTATIFSVALFSESQIAGIVSGILIAIIGIISALLPANFNQWIPYAYYTFSMLARVKEIGKTPEGLAIFEYQPIEPRYWLIAIVSLVFLIIFLVVRRYFIRRER